MSISDHHSDLSDVTLIERVRSGDVDAFGVLHDRHAGSALALARRMSRSGSDADDLVSEGFARVLRALQRGKGPDIAFRPYLLSTIRRLAYDRTSREQREAPAPPEDQEVAAPGGDPVLDGFERDTAAAAFASLPERWRTVLWHTEVEGQSPAEVGQVLGMSPNAVSALAYRAREGLRQAYLAEHVPKDAASKECRLTTSRLGSYVRGGLTPARETRLRRHLDTCDDCQAAYLELASVNTSMPALVAFAVLGPVGGAYLTSASVGAVSLSAAFSAAIAPIAQDGATTVVAGGAAAATAVGGLGGRIAAKGRQLAVAGVAVGVAIGAMVAAQVGDDPRPDQKLAASPPPTTAPETVVSDAAVIGPGPSAPPASTPEQEPAAPTPEPTPAPTPTPTPNPATSAPPTAPPVTAQPTTTPVQPTTTTTTTTSPTTTTTTAPPPPPVPSELTVELVGAGDLVSGKPGVIVATVRNDGSGPGEATRLDLTLDGASLRGEPITPATGPGTRAPTAPSDGWRCTTTGTAALGCTLGQLAPGTARTLYVPVEVSPSGPVKVTASATATNDAAAPGATPSITIPTEPSGLAARFATVDHGAVATAGNTLLTCDVDASGCEDALAGLPGAPDNGSFSMIEVDVDDDPATTNSSAAQLALEPGAEVLSATLYWSGGLGAGSGGTPAPDPDARGTGVLTGPDGGRVAVTADRVDDLPDADLYQSVADVTDLVAAAGGGRWTFGGAQLGTGSNTYGGWSLLVVQRHHSLPMRSLVVLDGFDSVESARTVEFSVGGFVVPEDTVASATIDVVVYEGDSALAGDQLSVNGVALADDANPMGNTFNSTASDRGRTRPDREPAAVNLLGLDLDRFDIGGVLTPGSTSTTIAFSTAADRYLTGAVAIVVDQ